MIQLTRITYAFMYLILLSPLLSYITFGVLGLRPIGYYLKLIVILYGIILVVTNYKKLHFPWFVLFALLWVIYLFAWPLFSSSIAFTDVLGRNMTHVSIVFMVLIVYNTYFDKRFTSNAVVAIKVTIIFACAVSVIQVINSDFLNALPLWHELSDRVYETRDIYGTRRGSIFGYIDQNALGLSFMPLASVLIGFMAFKKTNNYYIYFYLCAIGLVAVLSNARYVMVAFAIVMLPLLFSHKHMLKGITKYMFVLAVLGVAILFLLHSFGYDFQLWIANRLFREGDIQRTTRFLAIYNFVYFFPQYYLFGNGVVMDDAVVYASRAIGSSHIHVGYMSHLVAYGIVGCIFLYGFWALLARHLYTTARKTNYWGSFFAFIVFWWAFATFSQSSIFYYGLIYALVFDKYMYDQYVMQMKRRQWDSKMNRAADIF